MNDTLKVAGRIGAELGAAKAEIEALREQVAALQSGANSWQSGYDKGREDGAKSAGGWKDQHARDSAELRRLCAERDQLRQHKNDYMDAAEGTRKALLAEVETLRKVIRAALYYVPEHKHDLREIMSAAMAAKEA